MTDEHVEMLRRLAHQLRIAPGTTVTLPGDLDPGDTDGFAREADASGPLDAGIEMLAHYQARLAAQNTYAVLVVLQGLDAAGKDGAIKDVARGINPQGVHVSSFKVPSVAELSHDFRWR